MSERKHAKKVKSKPETVRKAKTKVAVKSGDRKGVSKKDSKQTTTRESKRQDEAETGSNSGELSYTEKEMLAMQIKHLEEKLQRRDNHLDRLQRSTGTYKERLEKESADKGDTVEFLKKALRDRVVEFGELQEKLMGLQLVHAKEKDSATAQYSALQVLFNETKDKMTEEIMGLTGKLTALEEFRVQKEDLEAKMAALESQLKIQQKQFEFQMEEKDKEVDQHKERLQREVLERVEDLAAEFRRSSAEQMSFTIKKTILENVRLESEAKDTDVRLAELIKENRELQVTVKDFRVQLEIFQSIEGSLVQKLARMKKAFQLINENSRDYQNLKDELETLREKDNKAKDRILFLEKEVSTLNTDKESILLKNTKLELELGELRISTSQRKHLTPKQGKLLIDSANAICQDFDQVLESGNDKVESLLQFLLEAEENE